MSQPNFSTNTSTNTAVSNIGTGESINAVTVAWILMGTDDSAGSISGSQANLAAAATAANSAGRAATLLSGSSAAQIAAIQTTAGYTVASTLVAGTYTPAIQWTKNLSGGGTLVGAWTAGTAVTAGTATTTTTAPTTTAPTTTTTAPTTTTTAPTTTTTAPIAGLLDFETTSLTPTGLSGAYINEAPTYLTRDNTVAQTGSNSMKFMANAGANNYLERQITLPSSGTISFERWFMIPSNNTYSDLTIFGLTSAQNEPEWDVLIYWTWTNTANDGIADGIKIIGASSIAANTWYKAKIDLNCSNNTYNVTIYGSDGTTVVGSHNNVSAMVNFSGLSRWLIIGTSHSSAANQGWIDNVKDGI